MEPLSVQMAQGPSWQCQGQGTAGHGGAGLRVCPALGVGAPPCAEFSGKRFGGEEPTDASRSGLPSLVGTSRS